MPTRAMIIVAGGSSSRFGADKLMSDIEGRPLIAHTIDAIVEHVDICVVACRLDSFEAIGSPRFFVQVPPGADGAARDAHTRRRLTALGLAHYNNWVKLTRTTGEAPACVTDLRIERIGAGHAPGFAAIAARGFGWPDAIRPWLAALVGRPAWRHYLAFDGDHPVATGALFVRGGTGWLSFAATDPAHRGRGAQSALVTRRIADARALGCEQLIVETAEETRERRATSLHNLKRLGFELAYLRPNYLWTAPTRTAA